MFACNPRLLSSCFSEDGEGPAHVEVWQIDVLPDFFAFDTNAKVIHRTTNDCRSGVGIMAAPKCCYLMVKKLLSAATLSN